MKVIYVVSCGSRVNVCEVEGKDLDDIKKILSEMFKDSGFVITFVIDNKVHQVIC